MTVEERTNRRLPRYRRTWSGDQALRLQERDGEILKLIYDYRFLTSRQIRRLVTGSDQVILRRLQKLYHTGFVDRIKTSNNEAILYALGNKGADEIALHHGIDRGRIDWTAKNRGAGERYLFHVLMIGNFRETLTLALRERPNTTLTVWRPEGLLTDDVVIETGRERAIKASLVPDGFFTIEDQGDELYCFLEADRSTMTNERFLNKMKAYWRYWREGKHKAQLGIENFRVLTVTKSEARKENLRRITREADDKQTGSLMFWFASEENYAPDDSTSILRPIWQTPRDDTRHHLLE